MWAELAGLLRRSGAPPVCRQAGPGKAAVVVVSLRGGDSPLGWQAARGLGEGGCTGKLCSLLAGGQACTLEPKEYSMGAHPSSSPLPNTGTLSLLWVQNFF